MRFSVVTAVAAVLLASSGALASPASEVASAFDEGDGLDVHISFDSKLTFRRAEIKREFAGLPGTAVGDATPVVRDLLYSSTSAEIVPRIELGIFTDLSLSATLPVVIRTSRKLEFDQRDNTASVDATNSTTVQDGLLPATGFDSDNGGGFDPNDPTIFRGPDRSGLDQIHIGLAWAPMNQSRDDTKPTWKIGAEARVAIGTTMRFDRNNPGSDTGVSRGLHEIYAYTSVAKRMSWNEPYFELWYKAPIGKKDDSQFVEYGFGQTSPLAQQSAGTRFGVELILWENKTDKQRINLDLAGDLKATFEGRGYTEMWEIFQYAGTAGSGGPLVIDSDPQTAGVQEISYPGVSNIENYLSLGGNAGINAELTNSLRLGFAFLFQWDQSHLISFADAGIDGDDPDDVVSPNSPEVNPAHIPVIDTTGRRYRIEGALDYVAQLNLRLLF